MARSLPPLNALKAFEAAGRYESYSRAADELNVSHSAISRHVRGLEDRLGVKLFAQAGVGVSLTADGQAYLARVGPALDDIAFATETIGEVPAGRVTINSDPFFAQQVLAPNLGTFLSAHPDIDLRLVPSSHLADVDRYEADFALRFAASGHLDRAADLVSAAPVFPYAAPGMFSDLPAPQDIIKARRVQDRRLDIWLKWAKAAGLDEAEVDVADWRMRAPLAAAAACGGGFVYLGSAETANSMCLRGELARISPIGLQDGAHFLLGNETQMRRKALRVVRSWVLDITERFRTTPFWEKDQPLG